MTRLALAAAALLAAPHALADTTTWNLDPGHSTVSFTVRHLGISSVRGEFRKLEGKLELDERDPTRSRLEVTIDASSVDTRNEKRDADLRSPNFLDVAGHPQMTFRSTRIERSGAGYKVTGDLTIRGNTRPTTLDVDELTNAVSAMGAVRRAAHATGKIDRKQYGLTWNAMVESAPVVGDEVKLDLSAEFVKAPGSPAAEGKAEDAAAKKP